MQPPPITGIESGILIDHCTYVVAADDEADAIRRWNLLGFREVVRLHTVRHPATHIALTTGTSATHPWVTMTGISVSDDPDSAVNEFVRRYGPGLQHVAYHVPVTESFEAVHEGVRQLGITPMTEVLDFEDGDGARLRQFFLPPEVPYGPFTEFIQRHPGADGHVYGGFDVDNIDGLHDRYVRCSRELDQAGSDGSARSAA